MQTIPLPLNIEIKENKENENQAQIIIEPCFPGYGTTLGNALRRILLSSLEGAAIIAVKIKKAPHEFSTLPYIKEDVLEIILNLKLVRIQLKDSTEQSFVLDLKAKGKKTVKAGDIEVPAGVKIVNPDLKIATLTDEKASLEMKIWIAKGRGYSMSEDLKRNDFEVGVIVCDAIFTPVIKVGLNVENIRVGEKTDYDKLILDIETDGTITHQEALKKSAKILVEQFNFITERISEIQKIKKEEGRGEEKEKKEVKEELKQKRGRPKKTK